MKNNYLNILIVSGGSLVAGFLNYIFHPLMLRYLTIEDFGVFGSLIGIFNILGILTTAVVLYLNKIISQNINDPKKIKFILVKSIKILFLLGIVSYMFFIILSPLIQNFLKISDINYILLIGITLIISLLLSGTVSFLRGMKKFLFLSFENAIGPLLKLVIGIIVAILGFKIYGALFAFLLSGLITFIISIIYLLYTLKGVKYEKEMSLDFISQKKEIFSFFLLSFFLACFMNIDVILAKNLFDETTAGIYAGISILGKFLVFLLISIETVYYGQIMEHEKSKVPPALIRNPLILITIGILGAIAVNLILGKWILTLMKPELAVYSSLYIVSLIYYGLLAYINFLSKVLIAWKNSVVNIVLGTGLLVLIVSLYMRDSLSLASFVYIFIALGVLVTLGLGFIFHSQWKK